MGWTYVARYFFVLCARVHKHHARTQPSANHRLKPLEDIPPISGFFWVNSFFERYIHRLCTCEVWNRTRGQGLSKMGLSFEWCARELMCVCVWILVQTDCHSGYLGTARARIRVFERGDIVWAWWLWVTYWSQTLLLLWYLIVSQLHPRVPVLHTI